METGRERKEVEKNRMGGSQAQQLPVKQRDRPKEEDNYTHRGPGLGPRAERKTGESGSSVESSEQYCANVRPLVLTNVRTLHRGIGCVVYGPWAIFVTFL